MFTEVVSMIGREDDDGVIPQSIGFQRIEHPVDLRVYKCDAGVVGLHIVTG